MSPILSGHDLRLAFGSTQVLRGVSVSIEPGEVVAVMGPSGQVYAPPRARGAPEAGLRNGGAGRNPDRLPP